MGKLLKYFALLIVVAFVSVVTTMLLHAYGNPIEAGDVTYSGFVSVVLTALSLMITILGIFAAALGVVGWNTIETKLKNHSAEFFANQLGKDGPLRTELEDIIKRIAYEGVEGLKASEKTDDSGTEYKD